MSQIGKYISLYGAVETITGNVGGAVSPIGNNINIVGGAGVAVTGNPLTGTLTITAGASVSTQFNTDDGNHAIPALNILTVAGGGTTNLATSSAGSTVTIGLIANPIVSGTLTALTLATSTVATNLQINANTITAAGTNANVDINLTTQGTGGLVFRGIPAGFVITRWHTVQNAVQTTNATPTNILSIPLVNSLMVSVKALINGFQDDYTDCVGGEILVTAYRPAAGNIIIVGAPIINVNYTDLVDTSDIDAVINVGTQSLEIKVIGVAAQNWNWVATTSYMYTINNA